MAWWGKIIGGSLGFLALGPIGAVLGVVIGQKFDQGTKKNRMYGKSASYDSREVTQTAFFTATFSVMGYIAKADGYVSEQEISHAKRIMQHMSLDAEQRQLAIDLFRHGKTEDFPLHDVLGEFYRVCRRQKNLRRMFLMIQIEAALSDGRLDKAEHAALYDIAAAIGFSQQEFEGLFETHDGGLQADRVHSLEEDYKILGISSSADESELKRAYRRLMSQYHPDKLVAKGLPDEMLDMATEKTKQIRGAYDRIRTARKNTETVH